MKKIIIILLCCISLQNLIAQQLELKECIEQLTLNYPLLKQKDLEKEINAITNKLNNTSWLPQVSLNGQASYQSDVTSITVPNISIETLSKEQYKAYVDVNQTLYDGGVSKLKRDLQNLNLELNSVNVDIEIRKIILHTQNYFFNALIAQESINILKSTQDEIKARIKVQEAGVKFGTVKQSQVDILKVELLKIDQKIIEISSTKRASIDVISLLTGMNIDENRVLKTPIEYSTNIDDFNDRLEFKNYTLQQQALDKNTKLTNAKLVPRANLFGQAGYGRPGLNQLSNDFDTYYLVGARVRWDMSSLYNLNKNKKINQLHKEGIEVQKDVFETNLKTQKAKLDEEIKKLEALIEKDKSIVTLRKKISKVASVELDNGISTATNYLIEKNAENQAVQSLTIHQIQKTATQYLIKLLTGN